MDDLQASQATAAAGAGVAGPNGSDKGKQAASPWEEQQQPPAGGGEGSWQAYIDSYLTGQPGVAAGAIVSPDTGVWGASPGCPGIVKGEADALWSALGGRGGGASKGTVLTCGGRRYRVATVDLGASPARLEAAAAGAGLLGGLGLGGGGGGVVVAASGTALVVGFFGDAKAKLGCGYAVVRLAEALLSYGY